MSVINSSRKIDRFAVSRYARPIVSRIIVFPAQRFIRNVPFVRDLHGQRRDFDKRAETLGVLLSIIALQLALTCRRSTEFIDKLRGTLRAGSLCPSVALFERSLSQIIIVVIILRRRRTTTPCRSFRRHVNPFLSDNYLLSAISLINFVIVILLLRVNYHNPHLPPFASLTDVSLFARF